MTDCVIGGVMRPRLVGPAVITPIIVIVISVLIHKGFYNVIAHQQAFFDIKDAPRQRFKLIVIDVFFSFPVCVGVIIVAVNFWLRHIGGRPRIFSDHDGIFNFCPVFLTVHDQIRIIRVIVCVKRPAVFADCQVLLRRKGKSFVQRGDYGCVCLSALRIAAEMNQITDMQQRVARSVILNLNHPHGRTHAVVGIVILQIGGGGTHRTVPADHAVIVHVVVSAHGPCPPFGSACFGNHESLCFCVIRTGQRSRVVGGSAVCVESEIGKAKIIPRRQIDFVCSFGRVISVGTVAAGAAADIPVIVGNLFGKDVFLL